MTTAAKIWISAANRNKDCADSYLAKGSCKVTRFLNNNVYFQTIVEPVSEGMEHLPNISNMRDFVTVITPKLKFEFHRDYMKAVKELKGLYQSYSILSEAEKAEKKKLLE